VTTPLQTVVRRAAVTAGSFVAASAALVAPAVADVPEGWSHPDPVSAWKFLLVVVLIPVALGVVITLLTALPGMVRGEHHTSAGGHAAGEWIGGPRAGTSELADPDDERSEAGGASARW
jgi:hypothetical protein